MIFSRRNCEDEKLKEIKVVDCLKTKKWIINLKLI